MDIDKFNSLVIDLENIIEEFKKEIPEVYHQNYDYFSQLRELERELERKKSEFIIILFIIVFGIFVLGFIIGSNI